MLEDDDPKQSLEDDPRPPAAIEEGAPKAVAADDDDPDDPDETEEEFEMDPTLEEDLRRAALLRDELAIIEMRGRKRALAWQPPSPKDLEVRADAQARCDAVATAWGSSAPPPMPGELTVDYRVRLLKPYLQYSPKFKNYTPANLATLAGAGASLDQIEREVYADAALAARNPPTEPGTLRQVRRKMPGGHDVVEFFGSPRVAFAPFLLPGKRVTAIGNLEQRTSAAMERLAAEGRI